MTLWRILTMILLGSVYAARAVEPSPAKTGYSITGIVVSSMDESPVPHAHLNAVQVFPGRTGTTFRGQGPPSGIGADADDHGRFVLVVPSAGKWRLMASAIGFVAQAYNGHDGFSSAVVLTQSGPQIDLHFRLAPEAEIEGTVLDEAGEAVRNARVVLEHRPAPSPDREQQEFRNRMVVQTDDRGVYDFSGLAPGDYRVMVDAKPWYSTSLQPRINNGPLSQDPALDVTYQLTWFPGVDDPAQAETLSLKPAEIRRAEFQLVPIPAVHVIFPNSPSGDIASRRFPSYPVLERVDVTGSAMTTSLPNGIGSRDRIEIGGLAPGLYRMRVPGGDQATQNRLIQIRAGDSRVVDAATVSSETANITIETDSPDDERSLGVQLINVENGARFTQVSENMFFRARAGASSSTRESQQPLIQVPPGRYEVRLGGRDSYLLGIAAKGAEVSGRFLTVRAGDVSLKLRTARGRATVNGVAVADSKPIEGAMVVLVPAGLGDPGCFANVVRDQTNTDGSFDLTDIVPGQYILIAVTNGWKINWSDSATLQHYLTQGVPLDIRADARLTQEVTAQQP
jgi:hypothetical protein